MQYNEDAGLSKPVKCLGRDLQVCAIFQAIVSRQRYNTKITKDTMLVLSQNPVGVRGGGWLM